MTAADELRWGAGHQVGKGSDWCSITVEQARALADLLEACIGTVGDDSEEGWQQCCICGAESHISIAIQHCADCALAAVERVFAEGESDDETE